MQEQEYDEAFVEFVDEVKRDKERRRDRAWREYAAAARLAADHGLQLVRHNEHHYKLRTPFGRYELYPSNERICKPEPRSPVLNVPYDWTLQHVVESAIALLPQRSYP